ncbi:DUF6383 domain-containing protein [Parabacteroides johnsonii]|uniref:DUF6383 domain-containing protein n=1 Tax=Parabacteroides johnsonii TaxID=387661 RepID=UPI003AB4DAA0
MKAFSFLLVLSWLSISLFAQEGVFRYPIPEGGQPFTWNYPKANKVHIKMHNYFKIFREWDKYYDYSEDSLNLTIREPEGKQYIKYNLDGTMASFSSPVNNWNDTYTYTDEGKIERIDFESNDKKTKGYSIYEYNDNYATITSYNYSQIFDVFLPKHKQEIEWFENKVVEYEYDYDNKNEKWIKRELCYVKLLDSEGKIIEHGSYNQKNEKYQIEGKYEYTDDGYIYYSFYNGNNHSITEYYFNENGDLVTDAFYHWSNDNQRYLDNIREYTYTYLKPTSNEEITHINYKVYPNKGSIVVENNTGVCKKASIYVITGQLLKTVSISDNRTEIPLSSGIYIVVVDNQSYKVRIK